MMLLSLSLLSDTQYFFLSPSFRIKKVLKSSLAMKSNNLHNRTERFEKAKHLQPESSKPLDKLNQLINTRVFEFLCFFSFNCIFLIQTRAVARDLQCFFSFQSNSLMSSSNLSKPPWSTFAIISQCPFF